MHRGRSAKRKHGYGGKMLKEGRNKGSEGEELAEAVCRFEKLAPSKQSSGVGCQTLPTSPTSLNMCPPFLFVFSMAFCIIVIVRFSYYFISISSLQRWMTFTELNVWLRFCSFVSFRWKHEGECEPAFYQWGIRMERADSNYRPGLAVPCSIAPRGTVRSGLVRWERAWKTRRFLS